MWFSLTGFLATIANGLLYIVLTWLLLQVNNSVAAVAWAMVCFWVPNVFLGPLFGVLADRYSRRLLIIIMGIVRGLLLIGFAYYFYRQSIFSTGMIYALTVINGVAASIYWPVSIAFIREIVAKDQLLYANSVMDIAYELGNVLGMSVAGLLLLYVSPASIVGLCAIIFIIRALITVFITSNYQNTQVPKANWLLTLCNDFHLGLRYLANEKRLSIIYIIQLLLVVQYMVAPVLLSPFVKNVLHASVKQFACIEVSLSIGIVLGGIFIPYIANRYGLLRSLASCSMIGGVALALFAFNRQVWGSELLYFILGLVLATWPLIVTKAQNITDLDYQARVQSVFSSLSGVVILILYLVIGLGSQHTTITLLYLFEALLLWVAAVLCIFYRKLFATE